MNNNRDAYNMILYAWKRRNYLIENISSFSNFHLFISAAVLQKLRFLLLLEQVHKYRTAVDPAGILNTETCL